MLKPHHIQSDLLMEVAGRHQGRRAVNRRYCPPLSAFDTLLKKGYVKTEREGLPKTRTTFVVLTDKGLAAVRGLVRHYETKLAPEVAELLPA